MALIRCPECQKEVSDQAIACPYCGYGVAAHIQKERQDREAREAYLRTHKPVSFTEQDWLRLFKVYTYALDRLKTAEKALLNFRSIYFNDGVPSLPLKFFNSLWDCLVDAYTDIESEICSEWQTLSNADIARQAGTLNPAKIGDLIRPILLRWHTLVMEPFQTNTPAILRAAEHRYQLETAENASMGYGIITDSICMAALYGVQASMREIRAESQAFENKQDSIRQSMTMLQKSVAKAWSDNFEEFLSDTELCHQVFLSEVGETVFQGYLFSWKKIDEEYMKPGNQEKFRQYLQAREDARKAADEKVHQALQVRREAYLAAEQALLDRCRERQQQLDLELSDLGLALFGEKAKKKKELVKKKQALINASSDRILILEKTKKPTAFAGYSYSFPAPDYQKLGTYQVRDRTEFDVIYRESTGKYGLYDADGELVCEEVGTLEKEVGAFKQFRATFSNLIITPNAPNACQVILKLTNHF